MTVQKRRSRANRRTRRQADRIVTGKLSQGNATEVSWGFILTYWGTFAGVLGLAASLQNNVLFASILFGIASLQLLIGLWKWIGIARNLKLLITVASIVAFACLEWHWISTKTSIRITPSVSHYHDGLGIESNVFTVMNSSEEDLYEVEIRFKIEPISLSAQDFRLQIPESSRKYIDTTGTLVIGDINGFYCRDVKGQPYVLASIYHLAPHESRNLVLMHIKQQMATITDEVSFASHEQRQIRSLGGMLLVPSDAANWRHNCTDYSFSDKSGDFYTMDGIPKATIHLPPDFGH